MGKFLSWQCPYCNHFASIGTGNFSRDIHYWNMDNKDGLIGLWTTVIVCPNERCKEYTIEAVLSKAEYVTGGGVREDGEPLLKWWLKPQAAMKIFPNYIPKQLIADYIEACQIKDLSPKASCTLCRRCLQGIIRDFWGISKSRLIDEINELKIKIDNLTWQAIDSVRSVGNIGAHMEKDINLIIDVDPDEAACLISLIELLFKEWYIGRHDREERLKEIVEIADLKKG